MLRFFSPALITLTILYSPLAKASSLNELAIRSAKLSVAHFICAEATTNQKLKDTHMLKGVEHGRAVFNSINEGAERQIIIKRKPWSFEMSPKYSNDFNLGTTFSGVQTVFWHNINSKCEYGACRNDMRLLLQEQKYRDNNCGLLP